MLAHDTPNIVLSNYDAQVKGQPRILQCGFNLIRHPHGSLRRDSHSGPQPRSRVFDTQDRSAMIPLTELCLYITQF